jgi:hypothetical protein
VRNPKDYQTYVAIAERHGAKFYQEQTGAFKGYWIVLDQVENPFLWNEFFPNKIVAAVAYCAVKQLPVNRYSKV